MKKLTYILGIAVTTSLMSCEKDTINYIGQDGLYFDVRWGADFRTPDQWGHQYYTPIEFGNMTEETYKAQIRVTASGTIKNYDRPFSVTIGTDSTNAIVGEDYLDFIKECVLKAGEQYAYIDVTFNRTERMKTDTVTLQLRLLPNEYFTCPFTNYSDNPKFDNPETKYGYNPDATVHKIVATDMMTQPGGWWGSFSETAPGLFGGWTATKWRLMMEVTETTIEDYKDNQTTMPMARAQIVSETFGRYLLEEAEKGREYAVLDEDGSMMWCQGVKNLGGAKAWTQGTKPDEYYK